MSQWPSTKATRVLSALHRIGWQIKRQSGSHRTLSRQGWPDFVFAFHERSRDPAVFDVSEMTLPLALMWHSSLP